MAKRKAPELSAEAQAANLAGDAIRKKEKTKRAQNNEKQKRFRENMKAVGYKQVLLWALPCPADVQERLQAADFYRVPAWISQKQGYYRFHERNFSPGVVHFAAPLHEKFLNIADNNPAVKDAFKSAIYEFLTALEKTGLSEDERRSLLGDYINALRLFGDMGY